MMGFREWLADILRWIEFRLVPPPTPPRREGKWVRFVPAGTSLGQPCWDIYSQRGGLNMGRIRWSPQWRAYGFSADDVALYNGGSVAEIYAFLKERGQHAGRFV